MMKDNLLNHLFQFAILLSTSTVFAQSTLVSDIIDPAQQNNIVLYGKSDKFVGSRFLYEDFQVGSIRLISGDEFDKVLVRYNSFDDLVHFRPMDSQKESIAKNISIMSFEFYSPEKQQVLKFIRVRDSFYQKIATGSGYSILKKHGKKLIMGASPNGYNSGGNDTLDRLLDTESYLLFDSKTYITADFSIKRNDLYNFLVSKKLFSNEKEIKRYIQEHSIDFKSDRGIRSLIER